MSEQISSLEDFGAYLRERRKEAGISLKQISAITKISLSTLEALENNNISGLPGGIFSRAVVRSYASEIGLDQEDTLHIFLKKFPSEAEIPEFGKGHRDVVGFLEYWSEHRSLIFKCFFFGVVIILAIVYFIL